jgi:hypothetical protein
MFEIDVKKDKSDLAGARVTLEVKAELVFAKKQTLRTGDVFVLFFGKFLHESLFANCRISQECDSQ